jgi:alkaline phosphatase
LKPETFLEALCLAALALSVMAAQVFWPALAADDEPSASTGNVIFIHPDGSGPNHWAAARTYWYGPDAVSPWDRLPYAAMYRGHMTDQLGATSNGGATAHAFGYKVQGPDSYGEDRGRTIRALSGYPGSILREAASEGHPVGIVNDGDVNGEPGTGAFLAETDARGQANDHALQILGGRPGFDGGTPRDITDGEPDPRVVLGGGERFFVPKGMSQCEQPPTLEKPRLDCYLHRHPERFGGGPARTDGRNLLEEAAADGWVVLRTRSEFEALAARVRAAGPGERYWAPKVLGLFAADDLFNDAPEEKLMNPSRVPTRGGLVRGSDDPLPVEGREHGAVKIGSLVLWGAKYEDPRNPFSFDPPTGAEMTELALVLLERKSNEVGKPFAAVVELESTDNMGNDNNAIGTLRALERANDTIAVAQEFQQREGPFATDGDPRTLILTAADSDASGMQLLPLRRVEAESPFNPLHCDAVDPESPETCVQPGEPPRVTRTTVNPLYGEGEINVHVDGIAGRESAAFLAEPDAVSAARAAGGDAFEDHVEDGSGGGAVSGAQLPFAVVWTSLSDVAGGIVARAQGLHGEWLVGAKPLREGEPPLSARFDNTDVYRMMYLTLFGEHLPAAIGKTAPTR